MDRFRELQPWVSTALRLALAGVWLYAGYEKISDTEATVRAVRAFELLPEPLVRPWAYGMPLLELILGALLLLGLATRLAAVLSAALMAAFLFGISWAWAHGLSIDCGCFGGGGAITKDPVPGYIRDLLRDTAYLAMALFLIRWPLSRLSLDSKLGLTTPTISSAA